MEELTKRRAYAFIIDFLIVTLIMYALTIIVYPLVLLGGFFSVYGYWFILLGIVTLLYFSYLEYRGGTPGKRLQKLTVISEEGELKPWQVIVRNLSKVLWIPLIPDILIGYFTSSLRLMDSLAGTGVVMAERVK